MNMKKMRGVVDPLTLGFLLTVAIGGLGAATNANIKQAEQAQANVQVQQASVQPQAMPALAAAGK
ncbi:hypothetical protein [Thiothrix nivea]|uniref:Uncharacterized protein n=1 Tax=Thiothrix nivea (strain ATCC 35100 / DSM 5205 / JP2) TaxID=870187 RepID=A0A656HIC3_THINJ|nr:hypothetical protein [Thiothrix nivea]EIJ36197.1 hypothetical protein Thini_3693 [Thiothrix nivea DSM 5205]